MRFSTVRKQLNRVSVGGDENWIGCCLLSTIHRNRNGEGECFSEGVSLYIESASTVAAARVPSNLLVPKLSVFESVFDTDAA